MNTMQPERPLLGGLRRPDGFYQDGFDWSLTNLAGRLAELSGSGSAAVLTLVSALVRDAQRLVEPVAWITRPESSFYPPDVAECGIDLEALIVIRASSGSAVRSADRLLRSAAFGLVIVDLGRGENIGLPAQARLSGLAHRHKAALVFLTEKPGFAASLGPLVSIAATACRQQGPDGRFSCWLNVVKDKHGAPARGRTVDCRGPSGLRHHP